MKSRSFFEGAGAAILLSAPRLFFVLSPYQLDLYHSLLPVNTISGGILLDLLACIACFLGIFLLLHKKDQNLRSLIWLGLVLFFLACGVNGIPVPDDKSNAVVRVLLSIFLSIKNHLVTVQIGLGAIGISLWWKQREIYSNLMRGAQTVLMLMGFSILWIVPQLTYQTLHRQKAEAAKYVQAASAEQVARHQSRIVWLMFDELSFEKLFAHRPADLRAVNFDRFKEQSYFFTQMQPDGRKTEQILPSLFTGQHVEEIRSNLDGELLLRGSNAGSWRHFDERSTLFADARNQGWTTGLVGYFNPYCRILPTVLNSCFWISEENPGGHLSSQLSSWQNALRPMENIVFHAARKKDPGVFVLHTRAYEEGEREGDRLLGDESIHFAFVHVGVPHPPGLYDRKKKALGRGSYIDNLQLADTMLNDFLSIVERSPSADRTTIIVSSDHSWRIWMWQGDPVNWNEEDTREAQSGFDPRPVLMIHLPGQKSRRDVNQRFQEIKEHDILEAMFRKDDFSAADLEQILRNQN